MGSKYSHVFSPIKIRGIDFKNRITLAPPSPNLASPDGKITYEFIDWFRMFARGGVCTLYVGNSSIDITECKDEAYQLDLSSDDGIRELARFADMCKEFDCHASLEINHNGENTAFETVGHAPFSSSELISGTELIRAKRLGRDPIPSIAMTKEKIQETINKYGDAAARMKRAGMDIVLVHGGHGNLISQFTSPLYNHRTDEYGGSLENRARFAIEVCDNIRQKCGEDFVIEFRISADEIAEEGMHFDETLELIGMLKDHIDIIHVSAGLHSDFGGAYMRNWCQNFFMERGFNVHYAAAVKKAYPDLLVTTVGSITSIDMAEEIIANGWADFVAMCRPLMADPDMPNVYAHDHPEDHRPCLRCSTCMKHLMIPKPIFCAVNPMSGMTSVLRDGVVPKAVEKKKVAVVGGGVGCAIAYPIAKKLHELGCEVHTIAGFRTKDLVILEDEFKAVSDKFILTTDDGSAGEKNVVTVPLQRLLDEAKDYDCVITIGPLIMMKFVCKTTKAYEVKTIASMNPIMVDGTGMCGGCRLTVGGKTVFACVDGPDFDGHEIDFDEAMARGTTYKPFERKAHEDTCNLFKKEVQL